MSAENSLSDNEELGRGHRQRFPSSRLRGFVTNTMVRQIDTPKTTTSSASSRSSGNGKQLNIACYVD